MDKTMRERIGFLLLMLGVSTMDSVSLIVPVALSLTGIWLMRGLVKWQ